MISLLHNNLIWTEGPQIVILLCVAGLASFLFYRPLLVVIIGFFLFTFYFFRNPDRVCTQALHDPTVIVCPADGKIVDIAHDATGGIEGYYHKISIFLSPIDVHVNWTPIHGTIEKIIYKPGTFTLAFLPKSSLLNERNDIHIRSDNGTSIVVRQIAGTIARRICCWVKPDDVINVGTKIGMIRFGSRVDLLLPAHVEFTVAVGQRVYGGQTVLGRFR